MRKYIFILFILTMSVTFALAAENPAPPPRTGATGSAPKTAAAPPAPAQARDYLKLALGNRWVFKTLDNKSVTFEAVEKEGDSIKVLVSTEGSAEKDVVTWRLSAGFFVMDLQNGSKSIKALKVPPKAGDTWEFSPQSALDNAPKCTAMTSLIPKLSTPAGEFKNCMSATLVVKVNDSASMLVYVFAPEVGLIGMEGYKDGKCEESAILKEARIDGRIIDSAHPLIQTDASGGGNSANVKPADDNAAVKAEKESVKAVFAAAVKAFLAKDMKSFYSMFSTEYQKSHNFDDFSKKFIADFDNRAALIIKLKVIDVSIDPKLPNLAMVVAEITGEPQSRSPLKFVKENGVWKIWNLE
jgi:hypothetical protein